MTDETPPTREEMEKLVMDATLLARVEEYDDAITTFEAYLPTLSSGTDDDKRLAAAAFSYYGLCIAALRKQYSDAVKYCQLSLKVQPSNPEHYENQAKIHLLGRSRGRAVESLFEGLGYDPGHKGINKILDNIGRRREPVIAFLPRNNLLNVYFGKKRHDNFEKRRAAAMNKRRQQTHDKGRLTAADHRIKAAQARAADAKKKKGVGES